MHRHAQIKAFLPPPRALEKPYFVVFFKLAHAGTLYSEVGSFAHLVNLLLLQLTDLFLK